MKVWRNAATGIVALAILSIGAVVGDSSAVSVRGTTSTALYTQEVAKGGTGDDFENRTRLFQRLRFTLNDLGSSRLSFTSSLTARNDLTNDALSETRTRLYRAYLRYRTIPQLRDAVRLDVRFGRQWITAGVGSGTIDGAMLQIDRPGWGGITLFGGTLGIDARDQWRLDDLEDSQRLGAELRLRPRFRDGAEPEIAASYADTRRNDRNESRRLGLRASLLVRRQLRLWSQVRHDLHLDETFETSAGIEFLKPSSRLRTWAEFRRSTPALSATSYFRKFASVTKPITQLRGGLGFGLGGPYRIGFDFIRTDFKEEASFISLGSDSVRVSRSEIDRSTSFRLVLERGPFQIGGEIQSGFGGDRTRLLIAAGHDFGTRWSVDIDLGFESYDFGPSDSDNNTARSGLIATSYRPSRDTRITAQVEGLNNRDLKRDVRLLARIDQRFRIGR